MTVTVFILSLLAAMAIGMPIAYALLVCGVTLMAYLSMTSGVVSFDSQILAQRFVDGADNFPLLAVPFFLLAGEFMNAGGLSRRIVNLAMAWVFLGMAESYAGAHESALLRLDRYVELAPCHPHGFFFDAARGIPLIRQMRDEAPGAAGAFGGHRGGKGRGLLGTLEARLGDGFFHARANALHLTFAKRVYLGGRHRR